MSLTRLTTLTVNDDVSDTAAEVLTDNRLLTAVQLVSSDDGTLVLSSEKRRNSKNELKQLNTAGNLKIAILDGNFFDDSTRKSNITLKIT